MYVYLQAYKQPLNGNPPISQPLFAFVSLYLDGNRILEIPSTAIVPSATSRLGTMPLSFSVSPAALAPGRYDCQVTIVDPATQKTNFWRAPILVFLSDIGKRQPGTPP
jgi:hypothetical protein